MTQTVTFTHYTALSKDVQGYTASQGVAIIRQKSERIGAESPNGNIQLRGINSQGNRTQCHIALPREPDVLTDVANALLIEADRVKRDTAKKTGC